jgi:nicotinamide mononucleotide transporter
MIEYLKSQAFEYLGIITALLGVFYSIKQHKIAWFWNFFASLIYGFLFFKVGLYSDMELQGLFMIMAMYGFFRWNQTEKGWAASHASWPEISIGIIASLIFGLISGFLHHELSNVSLPFLDATLTGFSIWGTYLAANKKIENWLVWIFVDILYIGMYIFKGMKGTAVLYAIFLMLAFRGFYIWKKKLS